MSEEREIIPTEGGLLPTDAYGNIELEEVFNKMDETIGQSLMGLLTQNIREVEIAARTANALCDAAKPHASLEDQLGLGMLRSLTALYVPLVRATVFHQEGRFAKARDENMKGLAISKDAIAIIDEYKQMPNSDKELIEMYLPIISIFPIFFRGSDVAVRADIVGYQGNIDQYIKFLREAIKEFRQADKLPSSLNPMFPTLVNLCTSLADRLETRTEVFATMTKPIILPTGNKIFIIHGHDEAKWRELRDLLEDRFNLKTVVLKEKPGAGEVLIRKFEQFADDCCYAFALITPDDFITKEGKSYFQARPNVLFELGWFYGHFGRDRVCIVKKAETEMPSDLAGILSIDFHNEISEGFVKIQDELQRVGIIKTRDSE